MTRPTAMAPDASTSPVEWSRPIEAVHEDGTVYPAKYMCAASGGTVDVRFNSKHYNALLPSGYVGYGWRIRNVQPTTPEIDPALWDRMVALLRQQVEALADQPDSKVTDAVREARAIVAELPKPVDPDLIEARRIAQECAANLGMSADDVDAIGSGGGDDSHVVKCALTALRRGRELATPEVSHVG